MDFMGSIQGCQDGRGRAGVPVTGHSAGTPLAARHAALSAAPERADVVDAISGRVSIGLPVSPMYPAIIARERSS